MTELVTREVKMLIQFLIGHACFKQYLKRTGKCEEDFCPYCVGLDSPDNVIFECPRWELKRRGLYGTVGEQLTLRNIVTHMIQSKREWSKIH